MSRIIKRGTYGKYGTAIRKSENTTGFLAWAVVGATKASGPLWEQGETWFKFGDTAKSTLEKLHEDLDRLPR